MMAVRENSLWAGVIYQALCDATNPNPSRFSGGVVNVVDQDRARAWFLGNKRAFRRACELAGMDPDFIHEGARALAARGWPPPTNMTRAAA